MANPSSKVTSCREWADQAASDFMMLDLGDLPGMAHFVKRLESQATVLDAPEAEPILAEARDLLRVAADRVKNVILDREPDPAAAMTATGDILSAIQAKLKEGDALTKAQPSATPSGGGAEVSSMIDETIINAYVEQQISVLPEMENLILSYERERNETQLSDLRRIIHTLKGESGVVGALEIERVSHQLEDYLANPPDAIASDVLLSAVDWFDKAVNAFCNGRPIEAPSDFFAKASEDASVATPAPETETPAPGAREGEARAVKIFDPDLARDFVTEAQEHFDIADENLLILEKEPDNEQSISAVFRSFHTLKGVAGFLGLTPVGDLAHAAETLLDEIRRGQRMFSGVTVELVFGALDMLKVMVSDLQKALEVGEDMAIRPELAGLIEKLHDLLNTDPSEQAPDVTPPSALPVPDTDSPAELSQDTNEAPADAAPEAGMAGKASVTGGQTMKVEASRIDLLIDAIGELVIAESIVSGDPDILALRSQRLEKSLALLGKITRSLRDMGMSMRMVPVDPVFRKMARLVRDLSRKSGKKVNLVIEGGDTEIDKSMVEKLGDPLVHMIRNSMDHGLETGAVRKAAGKPEEGRIVLRAHHKGGNIHIDIEDDGAGLNRAAIVARAVEKGLIQSDEGMTDQEVFSLIFHAGFSTAAKVTEISGRGVGMDVVRRNIESLRGNVLIRSELGKGSVFSLVLPLTTAIIDGMLAQVGKETYILPTLGILESFRPQAGQVHTVTGRGEMVSFRDALLPLYRLSQLLGVKDAEEDPLRAIVMVVEEYGKQWGLMVDELLGQQQVVIKNLGEGLGQLSGLAGASILADGHPGLILDIGGIIKMARAQNLSDTEAV